jgi:DNA-binding response OmpR family regulator
MKERGKERVLVLLKRLARTYTISKDCVEELDQILRSWEDFGDAAGALANLLGSDDDPAALYQQPIINSASMTVTWQGRTCRLGSTILFRLMERLARRPNQYVPYDRLMRDVWEGSRSDDAIRAAAMRLKRRLRGARMPGLAKAIQGVGRHYGLILGETP